MTRFYFRKDEVPDITPAYHSDWTETTSAVRRVMSPTPLAGDTITANNLTSIIGQVKLHRQYISEPMQAGALFQDTVTTSVAWLATLESALNDNLVSYGRLRIVSQDGTTIRKELAGFAGSLGTNEWTTTRNFRRFIADTQNAGGDYTTVAGDRLVIEVGHVDVVGTSISGTIYFGSDSAQPDYPGITEAGADSTDRPWWETSTNVLFPSPPPATPAGSSSGLRVGVGLDAGIGWEVDGRPVRMLGGWQAESSTGWGDKTLTGSLHPDVKWAEQEAPIVGWRANGEPLWQGKLTADPRIEGDVLPFRAEGYANDLAASRTRMFYRIDGAADWSDQEEDPFTLTSDSKYETTQKPGALIWRFGDNGTAFATGEAAGFCIWVEGGLITRYSLDMTISQATGLFDLRTNRFTGPSQSLTLITDHSLNTGSASYASDITDAEDGLNIRVRCNGAFSPSAPRRVRVASLKVYGRTTDAAFSISDVVRDVAGNSGFGTAGVEAYSVAALPLDWTDDHPALLDYMAELADWRWLIRGTEITFGPYGRIWESATDVGAQPNLEPEPLANVFRQPFVTVSGAHRAVEASPHVDPLPGRTVVVEGESLEDPQPDDVLAKAVAAAAVEYEASVRMSGTVELREVRYRGEPRTPYDVTAGDQLNLTDLAGIMGPQRIESITYRPEGRVSVQIGEPFNLVKTLAEAERPPRRRRKRRRRRLLPGMRP